MNPVTNLKSVVLCLGLMMAGMMPAAGQNAYLLKPDRVFYGTQVNTGWEVLIIGSEIAKVGKKVDYEGLQPEILELPGTTLLPGLIEGHGHLLLHPYNETSWNDQVLKESLAERVARASVHAEKTLLADFTNPA